MRIFFLTQLCLAQFLTSSAQNLEITHQGNGTKISLPLESVDSVVFELSPPFNLKKIFQNNGNILAISVNDIDSITYYVPNTTNLPVVTTSPATVLSSSQASLGGIVSSTAGSAVTQRGVCWNTQPNPTIANNFSQNGNGTGPFTNTIQPLTPSTTYYARAYAINEFGTAYGNQVVFTTASASVLGSPPTVSTNSVTYTDGTTATTGGNITNDGGLAVTARGVCWAIGTTPTINNSHTNKGSGAGVFSDTLSNLAPNTTYFVRSYATNDAGTSYGITFSFSTKSLPQISLDSLSDITFASTGVYGRIINSGGSQIVGKGVCWSTGPNPNIDDNILVLNADTTSFYNIILGLQPGTNYFLRPFATNLMGTAYGNTITFSTDSVLPNIGDYYGGGIVLYYLQPGDLGYDSNYPHVIIASEASFNINNHWGCAGLSINNTSPLIGTGAANTTLIVNSCNENGFAARFCHDLSLNGYTDWYLPSIEEFQLIYAIEPNITGGFWSSTENDANTAFVFQSTGIGAFGKFINLNFIRPFRSF